MHIGILQIIGTNWRFIFHYSFLTFDFPFFPDMAKKLNQSQRRKLRKVKAAAANLTGPPAAPTTGQRDAAFHRTQPAARGRQSELRSR